MALFTEQEMRPSKKRTQSLQSNMVAVQNALELLCCFWHWMPWLCERYHGIWWLPNSFGAQRSGQCQKVASPPEVMRLPAGQWPKTHFKMPSEMVTNKPLQSSEMASNDSRSESHRTPVEISQSSSWQKASFKSEWPGVERCKKLIRGYRKRLISVFFFRRGCYQILR